MMDYQRYSEQRARDLEQAWITAYNRRLGPLDARNQPIANRVREQLAAMWPVYVEAEKEPVKRCPPKLEGQVGLAWDSELRFFASGSNQEEIDYGDSGYSALYERYLRTWENRQPLDTPDPQGFKDSFNVDAEKLLKLPYLAVARVETFKDPRRDAQGKSFESGRTEGQVHLFDLANRRSLCSLSFAATNSKDVTFTYTRTTSSKGYDPELAEKNKQERNRNLSRILDRDMEHNVQRAIRQAVRSLSSSLTVYEPEDPTIP